MRFWAAILMAAILTSAAHAQAPKSISQEFSIRHKMQDTYDTRIQPHSGLELSGKFKVWYLLGEPVINCTARWTNPGVLQVVMDDGTRVLSEPGEEEMWNLMLMAQFPNPDKSARRLQNGGGAHLSLLCDAGVVAQNGRNGFNVAGSPAWDKFICATPNKVDTRYNARINRQEKDVCASIGGDWLSSADAKKVAIAGIKIDEVMVHGVELSAGETLRRAEKMLWRQKSFAYKRTKAQDLQTRLAKKGVNKGIEAARRINTATAGVGTYPTAAMLEGLERVVETLRAELADDSFAADWRDRDRELVSAQLTRVAEIDRTLREREVALDRYRQQLENLAKDAPTGPANPLEDYIVAEHSLIVFTEPYKSGQGLKTRSGRIVAQVGAIYTPVVGESGTKYDFYIGRRSGSGDGAWVMDRNGNHVGAEVFYGGAKFHEELGTVSFLHGLRNRSEAFLAVVSLSDGKVLFTTQQTPIKGAYLNTQRVVMRDHRNRADSWARDYEMETFRKVINGRLVAYGITDGIYPSKLDRECTAKTEKGDENGVKPAFMYDLESNRLLTVSEHLCVPNPTAHWRN